MLHEEIDVINFISITSLANDSRFLCGRFPNAILLQSNVRCARGFPGLLLLN